MTKRLIPLLAAASLLGFACSSESPKADLKPLDGGTLTDAASSADGPTPLRDAGGGDARDAGDPPPLPTVHEPDTACSAPGGTLGVVYASSPTAFDSLGKVGSRRVASGRDLEGFVLFDLDGANASTTPTRLGVGDRSASSGTNIGTFAAVSPGLQYGLFDTSGASVGTPVTITEEASATNQALGRGGDGALLVWSTASEVRAATVNGTGALSSQKFELELPSAKGAFLASVAYDGAKYGVAWSVRGDDNRYRTRVVIASSTGLLAPARTILVSTQAHSLAGIAHVGTGFVVVVNLSDPSPTPILFTLDAAAAPVGSARLLDGTAAVYGMATQGTELGVVALRNDQRIEFRPFSSAGSPLGPWVCLDAVGPVSLDLSAAIDSDGAGYAILHRAADDALKLRRFDHLGTGP